MRLKGLVIAIILLGVLCTAGGFMASWQGGKKFTAETEQAFLGLTDQSQPFLPIVNPKQSMDELPEPVRLYLSKALSDSSKSISSIRIKQTGKIKTTEDSRWDNLAATQVISLNPPGLVWSGKVDYAPLTPLTIMTSLLGGKGATHSKLWGLISLFENKSYSMGKYLLLRWLAEAVWYPEVLLKGKGVKWEQAESKVHDASTAKITMEIDDLKVEGEFHFFRSSGAPIFFIGQSIDGYKWYCEYSGWKQIQGRQIPTKLVQGVYHGANRQERLMIFVDEIEY